MLGFGLISVLGSLMSALSGHFRANREPLQRGFQDFSLKSMPKSGLDCLTNAVLARNWRLPTHIALKIFYSADKSEPF